MTETELHYNMPSKMTDFAVTLFGEKIGVSVTRAFKWADGEPGVEMTSDDAAHLLRKKLAAIHSSSRNVSHSATFNPHTAPCVRRVGPPTRGCSIQVRNFRWRKQAKTPGRDQPHPSNYQPSQPPPSPARCFMCGRGLTATPFSLSVSTQRCPTICGQAQCF